MFADHNVTIGNLSLNACLAQADYFNAAEKRFILVTDVILSSAIFAMGMVLNSLSIAVLRRDIARSSMSILLLALSTFDTVFIGLSAPYIVVYMGLGVLLKDSRSGLPLQTLLNASPAIQAALPLVWYLGSAARTARNWTILIVSLDRYIVVQNPFMSARRSNPKRARLYCLSVSALALVYNAPLLLEYTVVPHACLPLNVSQAQPERLGHLYMLLYKKVMYIGFLSVGPVLWLLVFNALLIRSLLTASRIRAAITSREATRRAEDTKMLVVIIAVFVATELPGAVWQLLLDTRLEKGNWFYSYFYSLGSLLTLLNSAVNFFIYCVWSRNFRRNMRLTLGRGLCQDTVQQSSRRAVVKVNRNHIRFDESALHQQQQLLLQQKPPQKQKSQLNRQVLVQQHNFPPDNPPQEAESLV